MIITKTTDISDIYNDLMQSLRDSSAIVTKYSIERFPLDRLKSTSNIF
jgi:hypothetical protein